MERDTGFETSNHRGRSNTRDACFYAGFEFRSRRDVTLENKKLHGGGQLAGNGGQWFGAGGAWRCTVSPAPEI
jgi:hypothetical protein